MTFEIIFQEGTSTKIIYEIIVTLEKLGYKFNVTRDTYIKLGEKT